METILIYIIQSSICLTIFYAAYKNLLAKETFFGLNRAVLLISIATSLCLPFIKIDINNTPSFVPKTISQIENAIFVNHNTNSDNEIKNITIPDENGLEQIQQLEPIPSSTESQAIVKEETTPFPWLKLISIIYILGVVINISALVISYFRIMKMINSGTKRRYNKINYCVVEENVNPFSLWKYIVLSKDEKKEIETIIAHESAHIQHQHFLDILFSEIVLAFHWFNPFAWKLKQELKDIHEFQADNDVLNSGIDASRYQLLILEKAVGASSYAIANSFNHSKIKKRITMMLKQKSKSWNRLKPLFLIPVVLSTVYIFSCTELNSKSKSIENLLETETIVQLDDSILRTFHRPILDKDTKRMISGYGMRVNPINGTTKLHPGIDYSAPEGTTIYAVKDGKVIEALRDHNYGFIVKIAHGNDVETWYAHNKENLVKTGDKVKTGQPIALVGNTGISTGSHLHFEVRILNIPVNPFNKKIADWNKNKLHPEFIAFLSHKHPMPTNKGKAYGYEIRKDTTTETIRMHSGLDFDSNRGDTIYAFSNGIVKETEKKNTGYGKMITIQHFDKIEAKYAHCAELLVGTGEIINAGQAIALVGNTGKGTKTYRHLEVTVKGGSKKSL